MAVAAVMAIGMYITASAANGMDAAAAIKPFIEEQLRTSVGEDGSVSIGEIQIDVGSTAARQVIVINDVGFEDATGVWSISIERVEVDIDLLAFLRDDASPGSVSLSGVTAIRKSSPDDRLPDTDDTGSAENLTLSAIVPGVLEVLDWAASLNLGRITMTDVSLINEGDGPAAGLSGGWLTMIGTNGSQSALVGFSVLAEGKHVGRARMALRREGAEGTVQLVGELDHMDFPRFGDLLGLRRSDLSVDLQFGMEFEVEIGPEHELQTLRTSLFAGPGSIIHASDNGGLSIDSASASFDYRPDTGRIEISEFSMDTNLAAGFVSGHAYLVEGRDGLTAMEGRVDLSNVMLKGGLLSGASEFGLAASSLFKVRFEPFEIRLARAGVRVGNDDVELEARFSVTDSGWHGSARLASQRLSQESLMVLWPAELLRGPRRWLRQNVTGTVLEDFNAEVAYDSTSDSGPSISVQSRFDDAVIRYFRRLPPAIKVGGYLGVVDGVVGIKFERALLSVAGEGPINLAGSDLTIPKVSDAETTSTIRLRFSGGLATVLALLDHKPYNLLAKAGLVRNEVEGQATGSVTVSLPFSGPLDWSSVRFAAQGTAFNVRTTSRQGAVEIASNHLRVAADNSEVVVSGTGTINGVSGSGRWRMGFGGEGNESSLLVGKVNLSNRLFRTFNLNVPDGLLADSRNSDYYVSFVPGSPAQFGITAAASEIGLVLPFMESGTGSTGVAKVLVEGRLADNPAITRIMIEGDGVRAEGRLVPDPVQDGSLLEFSSFTIRDWFDSAVMIGKTPDGRTRIDLVGGFLDFRKAPDGAFESGSGDGAGQVVNVNLDRVDFNSQLYLTDLQGTVNLSHRIEGSMTGKVNGGVLMGVRVSTSSNGLAAYFATNNAGAAMSDAGVTDGLEGGVLELSLIPNPRTGAYDGQVTILNSTVKNLPALTTLLNIVTIVGLLDQLVSQGITFAEIEAEFSVSADRLRLKRGTAIGPALGIRMNGEWNMENETVDLTGTITPFSPLSELARITPLQLFGIKKGAGLGAISFGVSGSEQNLEVRANPLSAIAPGFLREPFDY